MIKMVLLYFNLISITVEIRPEAADSGFVWLTKPIGICNLRKLVCFLHASGNDLVCMFCRICILIIFPYNSDGSFSLSLAILRCESP